jgi:uncharacterized protein YecE (DUF72 family)
MTADLRIGCSSWTSEAWQGRFYPPALADGDRLAYYARKFDSVEVDSTYYHVPARGVVEGWKRKTPPDFRFTLKLTRDFLGAREPADRDGITRFLDHVRPLGGKLGPILLQYTPSVRPGRSLERMTELWDLLDPHLRYAVELRDAGWFQGETMRRLLEELRSRHLALVWSFLTYVDVPPEVTTDLLYVRFIGDHTTVPAETHGELRIDRSAELSRWSERVRSASEQVSQIFVFFNNHFQGFAPASVNLFRGAMGLPPIPLGVGARQSRLPEEG